MFGLSSRPRWFVISLAILTTASLALLMPASVNAEPASRAMHVHSRSAASLRSTIWRPNGTVHALLTTRTRIYLGGEFTKLLSPGNRHRVRRVRIAALHRKTGRPVGTFQARVNGPVRAMAIFGHKLYIGGDFTRVNGRSRSHFAALRLTDGKPVGGWKTQVDGTVLALLSMRGRLYVGGNFGLAGGVARDKLFALDRRGDLVAGWPAMDIGTNGGAYSLAATPDRTAVIVGGAFHTLVGQPRTFLGSITTDGQTTGWAPTPSCTTNCFVRTLDVAGRRVFAGIEGPGGHATAYRLRNGKTIWTVRTSGDVSAMAQSKKRLLLGGHFVFVSKRPHTMFAEVSAATGGVKKRRVSTSGRHYPGILAIKVFDGVALLAGAFDDVAGQRHLAVVRP